MSKFALAESTITFRGQEIKIRELTHAERTDIMKKVSEDKFRAVALFASAGCVDPTFTEEEAAGFSSQLVEEIAKEVMKISGMSTDEDDSKKS